MRLGCGPGPDRRAAFLKRVVRLPDRLPSQTLCHWGVRDDNLLVRPDRTAAILDCGMARPLAQQPAPAGLPTITAFRAREAARMLAAAQRGLSR